MSDVLKRRLDESEIDTVLAEDIDFDGMLSFKDTLMIKGKFNGEIKAEGDLYIGEKADITAKIQANVISARGAVSGNIKALSRVELYSTARVEGDIVSPDLIVESGAKYNGVCTMQKKSGVKNEQ
ncbi:MAG: polymer-forming cytoskeletal protein [Spirochaetales bacterium]|nr:polymer-forming cytoskeletal protein [Spirochaetales bacterium]